MKTYRSLALGLLGAAAIGVGAVSVGLAQPAPGPGGMPPEHGMRMDPAQRQAMMQQHTERMAARLRAVLQLRADQEPALQALIAAMRPPEGMGGHRPGMGGMGGMGRPENLTTPQRLDRMSQMMAEHQRRFQAHADAIRRFYAQLTPTQQAAFDALPPMMMGHGRPHGMGGPGMRGPRGMHGGPGMGGPGMGGPGMGQP